MSEIHKIWTMVVGEDRRFIGNKGLCEYRFVPKLGEHILFPKEGDEEGEDIYEVVGVRHAPQGNFEVCIFNLGDHMNYRHRLPEKRKAD